MERNIENLLDAIQQGIFTKSTKTRVEELEATKEDLEIQIANEKIAKPKVTEDHLKSYFYRFCGMDVRIQKNRQMLTDSFINRIYLYDNGRLVIYKDGVETITLEDIETALAEVRFGSDLVSFAVPKTPPIRVASLFLVCSMYIFPALDIQYCVTDMDKEGRLWVPHINPNGWPEKAKCPIGWHPNKKMEQSAD